MTTGLLAAFVVEALMFGGIALTALDMRAHSRVENLGGVNVWGYRGPVLRTKRANEVRVAIAGGDLSFGRLVSPNETIASYMPRVVSLDADAPGRADREVVATPAGAVGLPAQEYAAWLAHLSFLQADVVCLVIDPPDHTPLTNAYLPNRHSLIFKRFGYSPILPLVLQEKSALIRSRAVGAAGALVGAANDGLSERRVATGGVLDPSHYVDAIEAATREGLRIAPAGVVIVVPAPPGDAPVYAAIAEALSSRFESERRVRVVDLGRDRRLRSAELRLDGFSFSAAGNSAAANLISPAAIELIRAASMKRASR